MLEKMDKDIDAVAVSTPDHSHAVAAMMAIKMGKHVYCEKPLAHSIYEVRTITEAARKHKVATQLGNQGHSSERIRMFCEWIWDGAIGKVTEVHAIYSGSYNRYADLDRITEKHPIPRTLNWDLWLGPAPYRTYHPMYLPGKWRGWMQFGTGAIGDWVCHVLDPVFWALKLGAPMTVQADTFDYDLKKHGETFPAKSIVRYEFPARADSPPVKLTWYEGGAKPPRPEELEPGRKLPDICAIVIGDKGKIVYGSHGAGGARIIPDAKMKAYEGASRAPKTIPRSKGHYGDWIEACKGGKPASSNFDYGGPLTEIALLGIIATRTKNTKLQWDSKNMRITNCEEANQYINPPYRSGWTL
jgi:predicted dehydrogenase